MKRRIVPLCCFLALFALAAETRLAALDFFLRPQGFVFIPSGEGNVAADGNPRYALGFGGGLAAELDFASIWSNPLGLSYSLGLEGRFHSQAMQSGEAEPVQILAGGGVVGLGWYPLSRLFTRLDIVGGMYSPGQGGNTGLWWRGGGEAGFRITPMFTVAVNAGWKQYQSGENLFNTGLYAGLTLHLTLETGTKTNSEGASAALAQDDAVYPVLGSLYQQYPVGALTIRNHENAEIRDVRVSFRAGDYTASEFACGGVPLIAKGRSAELSLLADFSPAILRFADRGRILGEVIIRYRFLGQERQSVQTVSVAVYNHNTFPAGDTAALGAFVSPTSPEVLEYTKYVMGLARAGRRTGLNQQMEFGVWLFEGLRSLLVMRNEQTEGAEQSAAAETAQFPAQTLSYSSGSPLDIALLYAASLESGGIRAGLIFLPGGDILAAFDLGIGTDDAATSALFNGPDKLLLLDGEVWLPVAVSRMSDGFTAAWQEGIRRIDALLAATDGEETADMVLIEDAWANYPPAPFPAMGMIIAQPEPKALSQAAAAVMQDYITSEFTPKLAALQTQLRANPTASLYNQLGNLYLRSGQSGDAKAAYERAAGMGSIGAMTNRGNMALNENDNAVAERWFRQALSREPENKAALKGMETVEARR
ncbi:hypothetical protein AGMMS50293_11640 [Spirochaetia bacterium]|nr:hypothetical protein AGMMS50293_11640 [Spirochaetia bacterium]